MSSPTTSRRNICIALWGRAVSVVMGKPAIFYTLLLALILSGTVPQGFMRTTGADGTSLVLCTSQGPTEVWLTASGDIQPDPPSEQTPTDISDCLAITLSLVMVQARFETPARTAEFSPYSRVYIDRSNALIPAKTPLQPRAPPVLI